MLRKPSDEVLAEHLMQEVTTTGFKQPIRGDIAMTHVQKIERSVMIRLHLRRARLRRKPSDEVLDEQLMQEVAITGYRQPIKGPGDLPSPAAKLTLDSIYSSMDDTSNK